MIERGNGTIDICVWLAVVVFALILVDLVDRIKLRMMALSTHERRQLELAEHDVLSLLDSFPSFPDGSDLYGDDFGILTCVVNRQSACDLVHYSDL
jgi:hypothetical protein